MTCARKILLSLALVILGLGFSSDVHAVFDAQSFVCFNFASNTCKFNSDSTSVGISEYYAYSGQYPNRSTVLTHQTGSFNFTGWSTTNYATNFWFEFITNSNGTLYYQSNGSVSQGAADALSTAITSINSPIGGEISTSTLVVFDYDYFYDSTGIEYNYAGIELKDLTSPTTLLTPETNFDASGYDEYRKAITLITDHQYMWRPYLRSATSSEYIYGDFTIFNVISNPSPYSLYTGTFATSTATSSEYQYLNLISLLQNKHPIAYIPQTYALLQQEATLTGTSTFPEMTFDFTDTRLGSTTLGLTEVEMFSTSTITHFFNTTQIDLFKNLITAVIWVGVVTFLVNDIRRTLLTVKN